MKSRHKSRTLVYRSARAAFRDPYLTPTLVVSSTPPTPALYGELQSIAYWTDKDKKSYKTCSASKVSGPEYSALPGADLGGLVEESLPIRQGVSRHHLVTPTSYKYEERRQFYWYRAQGIETLELARPLDPSLYDAYLVLRSGNTTPKGQNWLRAAIELKDVKQTIQGLVDFIKFGIRMPNMVRANWRAMSIADVAKAYLTYKFGIQPTVSDVKKLLKALSREGLRVRGIKRHYRKGETVRTGVVIRPAQRDLLAASGWKGGHTETAPFNFGCYSPWGPWSSETYPRYVGPALKWVRSIEVKGCLFGRVLEEVDAGGTWNDDLAWSCPLASTAWELTPFSFLLDWVVDVGSVIERLDRTAATAHSKISFETGVWQSLRTTTKMWYPSPVCSCETKLDGVGAIEPWHEWMKAGTKVWSTTDCTMEPLPHSDMSYDRSVYIPSGSAWAPTFSWPIKGYQLSTGMALLLGLSKMAKGVLLWR